MVPLIVPLQASTRPIVTLVSCPLGPEIVAYTSFPNTREIDALVAQRIWTGVVLVPTVPVALSVDTSPMVPDSARMSPWK